MCTAGRQLAEGREEASSLTGIPFVHLLVLENFYRQQDDQFPTMLRTTSQATDYVASVSLSPGLAMACDSSMTEEAQVRLQRSELSLCSLRGFPDASVVKNTPARCRRHGFDPWVGKIPWRRA